MNFFARNPYLYMGVIAPSVVVFPIAFSIIRYKRLTTELKIAAWYIYVDCIIDIIGIVLARHKINNMPLLHIYAAMQFTMIAFLYKQMLKGTRIARYINASIYIFIIFCIVNGCFFQSILSYNSYTKSIESIIVIFFSIAFFKKILDTIELKNDNNSNLIYINSALLIYFSGSLTLFIISGMLQNRHGIFSFVWNTHATINVVMYILFAVAFAKCKNEG